MKDIYECNCGICRGDAIKIFFRAVDHDDPYWDGLVDEWYDEETDTEPSQWCVGRALGFTDAEMEKPPDCNRVG
jgi:hypothetical protein